MNVKPTVLVIDDEKEIRKLLRIILEDQNYAVEEAENGHQGLVEAAQRKPDIVLLDLGLPDMDGLIVLKRLREWSQVPVLVLTVRDDSADKVAALDGGADDYVTKPFTTVELLARLRAIQRRSKSNTTSDPFFQVRHLSIDFTSRTVKVKGQEVKLTSIEYSLLKILAQHAGKVVTHRHLLREVWGPNAEEQSQYLRVYVNHLRKKIELPQGGNKLIRNETGIGYRLLLAADD